MYSNENIFRIDSYQWLILPNEPFGVTNSIKVITKMLEIKWLETFYKLKWKV